MTRFLPALLSALVLSFGLGACGFHLREAISLPKDLGPLRVIAVDPYSALGDSLSLSLERAGATPAKVDAAGPVSTLRVISERWGTTPLAIDQRGRAQEFTLRYAVEFTLIRADGVVLVPRQVIELSRDYVAPPTDSIGQASESELLARELRREMTASVLRRVEAVLRNAANTARPPASAGGTPSGTAPAAGTTPAAAPTDAAAPSVPPSTQPVSAPTGTP